MKVRGYPLTNILAKNLGDYPPGVNHCVEVLVVWDNPPKLVMPR
jgi:hypothetical protein